MGLLMNVMNLISIVNLNGFLRFLLSYCFLFCFYLIPVDILRNKRKVNRSQIKQTDIICRINILVKRIWGGKFIKLYHSLMALSISVLDIFQDLKINLILELLPVAWGICYGYGIYLVGQVINCIFTVIIILIKQGVVSEENRGLGVPIRRFLKMEYSTYRQKYKIFYI